MDDFEDAGAALNSVRATQTALADRISSGGWLYDTAYSVLVATMVGGWALPAPANYIVFGVSTLLLVVLMRVWMNHYGVWLSGTSPKNARWIAWGLAPLYLGLLVINLIAQDKGWALWIPFTATSAAFVVAFGGSRLWRAVYRRENGLQP